MPRNHVTHGMSNTRLYRMYRDMINRCKGISKSNYKNYYGRGIRVCKEWDKFEPFMKWALSHGYNDNLMIDRIDVNGDYTPENCKFSTRKEQNNNTRMNHFLEYNGLRLTIAQWAEKIGINKFTLYNRLLTQKWTIKRALTTPVKRRGTNG